MAIATNRCLSTIFRFTIDVSQLTTNSIGSPEIRVSDVNWKIQLKKNPTDCDGGKVALGVYLVSTFDEANLSCDAQATFKLLRNDNRADQSIVKYLQKQKFTNLKNLHGFDGFVDWTDFHTDFVNDGKATFKVEISAEPPQRLAQLTTIDQEYAKLHVFVENVSQLGHCYSSEIVVRDVKWKVQIKKNGDDLGVFLCPDKLDLGKNWSYKVDCTFQLLALKDNDADDHKLSTSKNFHYGVNDWGYKQFLKWSKFTESYVIDDTANIIIEFKVHEPKPLWTLNKPNLSNANSSLQCAVCLECFTTGNICTIKCGHLFCEPCFTKSTKERKVCPMCKAATDTNELHPIFFT